MLIPHFLDVIAFLGQICSLQRSKAFLVWQMVVVATAKPREQCSSWENGHASNNSNLIGREHEKNENDSSYECPKDHESNTEREREREFSIVVEG